MTFLLRPCRGIAAYSSIPKKNLRLDLGRCRTRLEKAGYEVIDAKVMLVAKKETDITVYRSGRLLVNTDDKDRARELVEELYRILGVSA